MGANHIFHIRIPALVYLKSHCSGVLSNYTNFILFTGGKIFILLGNSFLRTYILKKSDTRKNIFPNLVLPGVTELFLLIHISLSQKWMELKVRLEEAEGGIVWGVAVPWPNEASVICQWEHCDKSHFSSLPGDGLQSQICGRGEMWRLGHCRKIIPFIPSFLSQVPGRIYQGKTI